MCCKVVHSSCALLQGAGTAIGELPPYFMARAARLSGQIDEEEQELEELIEEGAEHPANLVSINVRCCILPVVGIGAECVLLILAIIVM